MIEIN